jgi:ATP-dependent DNA ligase
MRPPRMDTAQLSLVRQPFDHPDFLFELKQDGFRALAHIQIEQIKRIENWTSSAEKQLIEDATSLLIQAD